jgi:hypothetical protein
MLKPGQNRGKRWFEAADKALQGCFCQGRRQGRTAIAAEAV